MKSLNTKSYVYYVDKVVYFKPFGLAKAIIVDDDCGEFIVTVKAPHIPTRTYVKPIDLIIIDVEEYVPHKWVEMLTDIEYEKAIAL